MSTAIQLWYTYAIKELPLILRNGIRTAAVYAVAIALPIAVVYCVTSAGWRFAAYLLIEDRVTIDGVLRYKGVLNFVDRNEHTQITAGCLLP